MRLRLPACALSLAAMVLCTLGAIPAVASAACLTSNSGWQNSAFATQTSPFTARFDVIPNGNGIDAVTGLSSGPATTYVRLAAIVRFNSSGTIDVRSGATYTAAQTVAYTAGSTYRFRLAVNPAAHTYSVYVTPPVGGELTLATNAAFRSEQASTSSLDNLSINSSAGTHQVCNFAIDVVDTAAPSTPPSVTASALSSTSARLSWGASSDNIGVTGYEVFNGATLVATLAATARSYDFTGLAASTSYTLAVRARDAAGNRSANASAAVTTAAPPASCATSNSGWQNTAMNSQSGSFTAAFDVIPNAANLDAVTGLSSGAATGYSSLAAIVRFNNTGTIDVRSGGAYVAAASVPYNAGASYHLRLVVNVAAHTYSVYVTAPLATETALAVNAAFRTEQASILSINNWAISSTTASHQTCSFTVTPQAADTTAPSAPSGLTATAASSSAINLSWGAASDNVGVTGYQVFRGATLVATVGGTTYADSGLSASTTYSYTVKARDAAGNVGGASNTASATTGAAADTTAPSAPSGLTATAASSSAINLSWGAATDNVGVTGYQVFRGGTLLATVTGTTYSNTGLTASTSYSYTVKARDAAGNTSAASNTATATTSAAAGGQCAGGGSYLWSNLVACGWPGTGNTGYPAGTSLRATSGRTISAAGTVIDGERITGNLIITAQNVTIRNSQILASSGYGAIFFEDGSSGTVDHVDVDGQGVAMSCVWHQGTSLQVHYVNCHNTEDGMWSWADTGYSPTSGDNFTIDNSYIHDLTGYFSNGHHDGFQTEGAANGTLQHNTIDIATSGNAAIAIWDSQKSSNNITVRDNLLAGGGSTVYAEDYNHSGISGQSDATENVTNSAVGGFSVTNVFFYDNRFSTHGGSAPCVGAYMIWFNRPNWASFYGGPTDGWHRTGNTILETGFNADGGNPSGCT